MRPLDIAPRRWLFLAMLGAVPLALVIAACAENDEDPVEAPDAGFDAPVIEAQADTNAPDAPDVVDAVTRTCSDQGFCHTSLPPDKTLRDVWGDGTTVWAVTEEGDVLRWDGTAWTIHARELGALFAIWGSGPTDLWIGGANGVFHGTGASAQAIVFQPVATPGDDTIAIKSIWGAGPNDLWAVGGATDEFGTSRGKVLRYRATGDAGPAWSVDALSSRPLAFSRVFGGASGVWVGGDDGSEVSQTGGVFRRAPTASAFTKVNIDAFIPEEGDAAVPTAFTAGGLIAGGSVMVIGRTPSATPGYWRGDPVDGGAFKWSYGPRDLNDLPIRGVWGASVDAGWITGDYGRLRRLEGTKWQQAAIMVAQFPVIEPLYAMWGVSADDFWVVGRHTALHRVPGKGL